jgi:hypothetical protein
MITLDGVMQAPGGPEEDTSGGFKYGGWIVPYVDEYGGQVLDEQLGHPSICFSEEKPTTFGSIIGHSIRMVSSERASTVQQNTLLRPR